MKTIQNIMIHPWSILTVITTVPSSVPGPGLSALHGLGPGPDLHGLSARLRSQPLLQDGAPGDPELSALVGRDEWNGDG